MPIPAQKMGTNLLTHFSAHSSNGGIEIINIFRVLFLVLVVMFSQFCIVSSWCYEDTSCAPSEWGNDYPMCRDGQLQSPINLERSKTSKIAQSVNLVLSKEYGYMHPFNLTNDGHTVSLTLSPDETSPCLVKGKGFLPKEPYYFSSLHFHWGPNDFSGSEHQLDDQPYPLELHMIHKQTSDPNKLAVFGILYKVSDQDNPALRPIVNSLDRVERPAGPRPMPATVRVNLTALLPKKVKVFRYHGSLTTPPCSEGVLWTVFDELQVVSRNQLAMFRTLRDNDDRIMKSTFRPVQPTYTQARKNVFYMKSLALAPTPAVVRFG